MAVKEEKIRVEGEVVEALPGAISEVPGLGDHSVLASIAGKMQGNPIAPSPATR